MHVHFEGVKAVVAAWYGMVPFMLDLSVTITISSFFGRTKLERADASKTLSRTHTATHHECDTHEGLERAATVVDDDSKRHQHLFQKKLANILER